MKELEFQNLLVRAITNADLRRSVAAGDLRSLVESGVSLESARRILSIDIERLELFSEFVLSQRITHTKQILKYTSQLLGDRLQKLMMERNHDMKPQYSKMRDHAMAFAKVLKAQFQAAAPEPAYLEDVLEYEITVLELSESHVECLDASAKTLSSQVGDSESWMRALIRRTSSNRILSVNHDLVSIIGALSEGRAPDAVEKRPLRLLIRLNDDGVIDQDVINIQTHAFIEACDGKTPLGLIIDRLATSFHVSPSAWSGFSVKCRALCESLLERNIVQIVGNDVR